jgi:ribosomal protein S18 acetylase RimI-like enzyme
MTTAIIRRALPGDAAAVTALTRAAYAKWVPVIGREPLPMAMDHAAMIRDHRVDLLFVGEVLAALVEVVEREADLLIENLAVAPGFQGRGFGKRMLAHAEGIAVQGGRSTVRLYTNARFTANVGLYLALDYQIEREEVMSLGTIIHMARQGLA